jgi:hypothetical protein
MPKSKEIDISQLVLKVHKHAVKKAIETAARTGTLLVSREGSKIKMVKPNIKYVGFVPVDPPKKKDSFSPKKARSKK